MRLTFLGGAGGVGRLACMIEHDGTRLLVDYGLAPTDPPRYPAPAPPVDGVLLTHAHLDHAGMMPLLAHEQGAQPRATPPTIDVAALMATDALNVHAARGYPAPYSEYAPKAFAEQARAIAYETPQQINTLEVAAWNAGHIPGSAMFAASGSQTVVFTGDLNTGPSRLVPPAKPAPCHTLVMEATYSGRAHPAREETEAAFLEAVRETIDGGGTAIVPCFAVGRTQEVLMVLASEGHPIFMDGLGVRVTEIFLRHPGYLKSGPELRKAFSNCTVVRNKADRAKAAQAGNVILTTSGMVEGGPVLGYLDKLGQDTKNAVLLTGYQVPGTNGRLLLDDGCIKVGDRTVPIECRIGQYDFSGHAGHDELLEFARSCTPETVILMHSDDPKPLADDISDFARVVMPENTKHIDV